MSENDIAAPAPDPTAFTAAYEEHLREMMHQVLTTGRCVYTDPVTGVEIVLDYNDR